MEAGKIRDFRALYIFPNIFLIKILDRTIERMYYKLHKECVFEKSKGEINMNRVYEGIQFATVTITLSAVITLITLFVTPSVWQLMLLITGEVIVINAAYLTFVLILLGLKKLLDYWEKNQNRFKSDKSKFKYLN